MEVKQRLTEIREAQGMSQEALAEALEVSRQTVSKWERGEAHPSAKYLARLSQLYGVSLDDLILEDGELPPPAEEPPLPEEEWTRAQWKKQRLALAAALILVAGILIGAWCMFYAQEEPVISADQIQGEVIDLPVVEGWDAFD